MIEIDNRQEMFSVDDEFEMLIKNVIEATLKEEEVTVDTEVSVIFIDNEYIKDINLEFRNKDSVTDVLSFPLIDYPEKKVYKEVYLNEKLDDSYYNEGRLMLGDIAISLERTKEQSIEYGHSMKREAAYLVVHSVLHLLGYDHMIDEDKQVMRAREEFILNKLDIKRL